MLSSSLRHAGVKSADASRSHVRRATTLAAALQKPKKPDYDIKRLKSAARALIDGAKQANNPEWRHTLGRKGDDMRLERDLLVNPREDRSNAAIATSRRVEDWTVEEFVQTGTNPLQPGTYFELRRNAESMNGVVLASGVSNVGHNEDTMSINTRGEVILHRASDVMFAIPNFIDNYLVERCGKTEQHEDQHQLAARLRVLKAARDFDRAVEREQYRLGRAIRDVYPQVRARNPDEWSKVTTMQVARMLDAAPNVPIVTLFAVHKQLMDRADEFICHPSRHRFMHTFGVRPLSHLRNIETVKQMVREKSPVIRYFQEKAKFLIDRSRELAAQSVGEPPSRAEIVDVTKFTPKEQEIITFLKLSIMLGRNIQQDSYAGNVPAIIKDTFRYDELITAHVTLKFLREIGVFTPWEDIPSKDRDLNIPDIVEEPLMPPVTASTQGNNVQKEPTKTPGLLSTDPHESVRHDFGDMPVYVIDDASAEELDDGVSVERVPGEPDSVWIHVHVADPTSIVPITHPLSLQIQRRTESYYFAHQTWPMLPDDIGRLCDMGCPGVETSGQNALTFSAKIGPEGGILDYKICASRVRNIHKLRYDDVNAILLPQAVPATFTPFEPELSNLDSVDSSYVLPHAEDLKLLYNVTRRLVKDRLKQDIFVFSYNSARIEFAKKPMQNPPHIVRPILYRGYPKLRYYVHTAESPEVGSRSLIAECMKIAGRVASRFCLEHNIPVIRRAMVKVDIEETKLSRLLAARNELGYVDLGVMAQEGVNFQLGELTTKPVGHWLLGIPDNEGYVRTTSPLRRAEDMIVHWQIKSALLPGGASPPIDEDAMNRLVEDLNGRKQALKRAYRAHIRQWAHTYIQRFMEGKERTGASKSESNPLLGMDGCVIQNPTYNIVRWSNYQDVYIPKLGLTAVLPIKINNPVPIGEHIKVKAKQIFQYDLNHTLEVALD